jgi:hypothetical protein
LYDKVYRPIIKYDVYFSEGCVFSNGYLTSVFQEWLGETNSANECAVLVKSEKPSAIGATWSSIDNYDCYAEFGKPAEIVVHKYYKACLFSGKYIALEVNV